MRTIFYGEWHELLFYVVVRVVCPIPLLFGRKHLTHSNSISFFGFFVVPLAFFNWVIVILFCVLFHCLFFGHLDILVFLLIYRSLYPTLVQMQFAWTVTNYPSPNIWTFQILLTLSRKSGSVYPSQIWLLLEIKVSVKP